MKVTLELNYTLPTGRLTPYLEGLEKGQALAAQCDACRRVAFPPSLTCAACGGTEIGWKPLSGKANVLFRTDTADQAFALVHFDGSGTSTMVRLSNSSATGTRGRLVPSGEGGGLLLALEETENDHGTVR